MYIGDDPQFRIQGKIMNVFIFTLGYFPENLKGKRAIKLITCKYESQLYIHAELVLSRILAFSLGTEYIQF